MVCTAPPEPLTALESSITAATQGCLPWGTHLLQQPVVAVGLEGSQGGSGRRMLPMPPELSRAWDPLWGQQSSPSAGPEIAQHGPCHGHCMSDYLHKTGLETFSILSWTGEGITRPHPPSPRPCRQLVGAGDGKDIFFSGRASHWSVPMFP